MGCSYYIQPQAIRQKERMDQYEGTALGDSCIYESERFKTIFRFTKRLINLKLTDHLDLYFLLIFASLNLFVFDFSL